MTDDGGEQAEIMTLDEAIEQHEADVAGLEIWKLEKQIENWRKWASLVEGDDEREEAKQITTRLLDRLRKARA